MDFDNANMEHIESIYVLKPVFDIVSTYFDLAWFII